jgi:hypothetical protein
MRKIEQRVLRHDVQMAEKSVAQTAVAYGKNSKEYQEALKRFARLWSVLKMTRSHDEFITEVTQSAQR